MLKRLIAFMAVLAMVAGVAFGQASFGGQLLIGTNLLKGDSGENSDVTMGGIGFHEAKMLVTFGDDKGGGKLVLVASNPNGTAYAHLIGTSSSGKAIDLQTWGFLFWRPIQQFRMQVGVNADGDFGIAQISGWGFTSEAKNSVGAMNEYENFAAGNTWWPLWVWQSGSREGNAFYPGTGDAPNVNFQFFPIYGLTATLVLPIDGGQSLHVQDQISDFHLSVKYNIEEVGMASFSFIGRGGLGFEKDKTASAGDIYASFYLTALEGMVAELGLTYNIPWETASGVENGGYMGIGAGFSLNSGGPFTFKARVNATLGGKTSGADRSTLVYANILPCYKITNNIWAFFYAGICLETMPASGLNKEYMRIGWFVNPYIWVRASEGLRFWSGIQFYQTNVNDPTVDPVLLRWRVPFGFNFYF